MTRQRDILSNTRHLIIDMDGVLYRGDQALPGTRAFIDFLRERRIGFVMATNNATRTPQQFVDKLAAMDVRVAPEEIITSAQATAGHLAGVASPGARVFCVGQDGLLDALQSAGFELVSGDPAGAGVVGTADNIGRADYVVAGMDFEVCYERLAQATLHVRAGATFVGTNPDLTFPSERGIVPGAGSLLAFLEAATGVSPIIIGKPERAMMDQALSRLGAEATTTAMLGDRLETDILGGQRAGMATILVLTGITSQEMLAGAEIQPDIVFRDVGELTAAWKEALDG